MRPAGVKLFRIVGIGVVATFVISLALLAAGVVMLWSASGPAQSDGSVRVYPAMRIITMNPDQPFADTIAVGSGKILAVGSRSAVEALLADQPYTLDSSFEGKIILPGFIDPHIHATLALMFNMEIVAAQAWRKPSGTSPAVRSRTAFLARIQELVAAGDADEWLLTWGYHEPYHGRVRRADLDRIAADRPVLLWQRSAHEMIFNTAALNRLAFDESEFGGPGADWATGHLWEAGLLSRMDRVSPAFLSPSKIAAALGTMSEVISRGGITTVGEQGFPQQSAFAEMLMLHLELFGEAPKYRWALVPNAMYLLREHGSAAAALDAAESLLNYSTDRVRVVRHVKYYADGSMFGLMMQMSEPYLDGHPGEWMIAPDDQRALLEAFWSTGWTVHVHVNGDAGIDLVLDQFEEILGIHPRAPGQRLILEHFGYARPDQHLRLRTLGVEVSNNVYYVYELAPVFAKVGLGPQRAASLSSLGSLARAGVPFSFHSDFPMAPAEPLRMVSIAMTRVGSDAVVWGEDERISLDLALRAITIEAARSIDMEEEIGSLEVGKRADFTILSGDPYATPAKDIVDIPIWGTMFEGKLHRVHSEHTVFPP